VYPIGSTIKPAVAVAAMENHLYTRGETIRCLHTYRYFKDYQPSCLGYHGSINLTTALAKSCNYFFFELGRRVGALRLTDYYKQFGLGVATGIEVDDSAGILMEPKSNGSGDTLQIAIGQLNAFTPLQLANYIATLANGGTRYRPTLINRIVSHDISTVYGKTDPDVLNTVTISANTLGAVKAGMLSVTEDGTGRATLSNYPLKVGGKTGTSQVNNKADHSLFVVFAPFDKPEIAIAAVIENGASTRAVGGVVRDILDAYFFSDDNQNKTEVPFTVLK
ncbi:MAG: penicillin-binding protein, partial [Clostridia bacterium]|nr:penicillin-binding protein [Clostridia bacterium]